MRRARCARASVVESLGWSRTCQRFSGWSGSPLVLAAAAAPRVVVAFSLPAFAPAAVLVTTGAGLAELPSLRAGRHRAEGVPRRRCQHAARLLGAHVRVHALCEAVYGDLRGGNFYPVYSERRVARCVPDSTRRVGKRRVKRDAASRRATRTRRKSCLTTRCATNDRVPTGLDVRDDDARAWCAAGSVGGNLQNGPRRSCRFQYRTGRGVAQRSLGRDSRNRVDPRTRLKRESRTEKAIVGTEFTRAPSSPRHTSRRARRRTRSERSDRPRRRPAPTARHVRRRRAGPARADAPRGGHRPQGGGCARGRRRARGSAREGERRGLARALGGAAATAAVKTDTSAAPVGPNFGVEEVRDRNLCLSLRVFLKRRATASIPRPLFVVRASVAHDPNGI